MGAAAAAIVTATAAAAAAKAKARSHLRIMRVDHYVDVGSRVLRPGAVGKCAGEGVQTETRRSDVCVCALPHVAFVFVYSVCVLLGKVAYCFVMCVYVPVLKN